MRTDWITSEDRARLTRSSIAIRGAVQGVGFRPFVYRLAAELRLAGSVLNNSVGVCIELEGPGDRIDEFHRRLRAELPPRAAIHTLESTQLAPVGLSGFRILESISSATPSAVVMPDLAMCGQCRTELFDTSDRRYRYPFINCTNCGPRFSIILSLPYDRPRTSMRSFRMCPECQREYDDPSDRRFHAQPNACPVCGPSVSAWDEDGHAIAERDRALELAAQAILEGKIVALKGIGGFQLLVDARDERAVQRLRSRKNREEKPLALMVPELASARAVCRLGTEEERTLCSPESPIVLADRVERADIAPSVAPGVATLGVMLPYSPLHALLMDLVRRPVVATSGNRCDEPMCIDEREALGRLRGIADLFLVHNRPILRHVDDSVVRLMAGREMVLRRARGFAPLPLTLTTPSGRSMLCLGAHQKNVIARVVGDQVVLSQHIGDLDSLEARLAFRRVMQDFLDLFPAAERTDVVCDCHPEYASTIEARARSSAPIMVQHHHAHAAACRSENRLEGTVMAVTWDGTGYGSDGTIWGGEFLVEDGTNARRLASLLTFPLFGGDTVAREPRRSALGLMWELYGERTFDMTDRWPLRSYTEHDRAILRTAKRAGLGSMTTSSMGRLFDGVASLTGLRQVASFEGQAAMELEAQATSPAARTFPYDIISAHRGEPIRIDWRPMVECIIRDVANGVSVQIIASAFHWTIVDMLVTIAKQSGLKQISLSGGCFQNKVLLESAVGRLRKEGMDVYWHQRVPPNDGSIALGQAAVALSRFQ